MEPIPLRTLTTLLNYERTISDERYKGLRLQNSTLADPSLLDKMKPATRSKQEISSAAEALLDGKLPSIRRVNMHVFAPYQEAASNKPPPATCEVHPDAEPEVKALTPAQLETIYHESHDHDGCYKALALYQHFFELCPPDQKLSIQIANEEPVLIDLFPRNILEFKLKQPNLLSISTVLPAGPTVVTGCSEDAMHAVLGFPRPGSQKLDFIVDMARMQWGDNGRGKFGEKYYMGSIDGFYDVMEKVCGDMEEQGIGATHINNSEFTNLLTVCAKKVWGRWQNREKEGWCDYCGIGGKLLRCSGCKKTKVWYCSPEHQKAGRKLHKHICEYKKTSK